MGMMDDMKDKMGDEAHDRFEELKSKQANGELSDTEREEFNKLRDHMNNRGNE